MTGEKGTSMKDMNFAVMVEDAEGRIFTLYRTQEEARNAANNAACMGYEVTVFDYDKTTGEYLEFYTI